MPKKKTLEEKLNEMMPDSALEFVATVDDPENPDEKREYQMTIWPDSERAVPNGFLRSSLFGVVKRGQREYHPDRVIPSTKDVSLRYKGEQLDQNDLDVWETLVHISRTQNLEGECRFSAYQFLKLLGKTDTGNNRKRLHAQLMRLTANAIEIQARGITYFGSLVDSATRTDETQEYVVTFNVKIKTLFGPSMSSLIPKEERKALEGKSLAKWLHGYYSSHKHPFQVKAETIRELSGSTPSRNFNTLLKTALIDLEAATGWVCTLNGGDVTVRKTTSLPAKKRRFNPRSESEPSSHPSHKLFPRK